MTDPLEAALVQLGKQHDHFAEFEQNLALEGKVAEAAGAHHFAVWTLRAWRAEADDPEPKPPCECQRCSKAYEKGAAS